MDSATSRCASCLKMLLMFLHSRRSWLGFLNDGKSKERISAPPKIAANPRVVLVISVFSASSCALGWAMMTNSPQFSNRPFIKSDRKCRLRRRATSRKKELSGSKRINVCSTRSLLSMMACNSSAVFWTRLVCEKLFCW